MFAWIFTEMKVETRFFKHRIEIWRICIWQILSCPVHCLGNMICVIFKICLFENYMKQFEITLQPFPKIIIDAFEFFLCDPVDKLWLLFISLSIGYMFLSMPKIYVYFYFIECSLKIWICTNRESYPLVVV